MLNAENGVIHIRTSELIVVLIIGAFALICLVISLLQFMHKGVPLNNAYLYASKKERSEMDMAPHFRQSAVVFLFLGIIFILKAIEIAMHLSWLIYVGLVFVFITFFYAIYSSKRIK